MIVFEVVKATEQRAMFDSWQLREGYTYRAFARAIERDRRLAGTGDGAFPGQRDVTLLSSDLIPANSSVRIFRDDVAGPARDRLPQAVEGEPLKSRFRPWGSINWRSINADGSDLRRLVTGTIWRDWLSPSQTQ